MRLLSDDHVNAVVCVCCLVWCGLAVCKIAAVGDFFLSFVLRGHKVGQGRERDEETDEPACDSRGSCGPSPRRFHASQPEGSDRPKEASAYVTRRAGRGTTVAAADVGRDKTVCNIVFFPPDSYLTLSLCHHFSLTRD